MYFSQVNRWAEPFSFFWLWLPPCSASSLQQLLHNTHLHSWPNIYSGKVARSRVHSDIPTGFWAYNVRKTFFSYGLCAPDIWCGHTSAWVGVYPADWQDPGLGLESQATKNPIWMLPKVLPIFSCTQYATETHCPCFMTKAFQWEQQPQPEIHFLWNKRNILQTKAFIIALTILVSVLIKNIHHPFIHNLIRRMWFYYISYHLF